MKQETNGKQQTLTFVFYRPNTTPRLVHEVNYIKDEYGRIFMWYYAPHKSSPVIARGSGLDEAVREMRPRLASYLGIEDLDLDPAQKQAYRPPTVDDLYDMMALGII